MANANPDALLWVTILLLAVVGLCLTMAFRLLTRGGTPRDVDTPEEAGAVERMTVLPETHAEAERELSAAQQAEYWRIESIQAIKADQPEASSDAYWKAEYFKRLARQEQKATAAARRQTRLEALAAGKKPGGA